MEISSNTRALSAATGNLGQYTVPQGFVYKLEIALKWYGGILDACDYIDTDMGNLLPWPSINDTANQGEVIAENVGVAGSGDTGTGDAGNVNAAAEQDPSYGVVNFSAYMFDSGFVRVPLQLIQDSAFNVQDYLIGDTDGLLGVRIGRKLNYQCTNGLGAGSSQPTGLLTVAPVGVTSSLGTGITYNNLLDLEHSVDPAYRRVGGSPQGKAKASWMFSDSTLKAIKKLTDSNGRPLFVAGGVSEGIINAAPDTLDGFPYFVNQDFPSIASSTTPMSFGDHMKYKIRRVRELQMVTLRERFIDVLQLGFLAWCRFDGNLLDAGTHPVKLLQMSAT